jgi:hypothetical protein
MKDNLAMFRFLDGLTAAARIPKRLAMLTFKSGLDMH